MEINFDITKYAKKKSSSHRFQELVLSAVDKFKLEPKWAKIVWGRIGQVKRVNESFAIFQLERAIRETEEHTVNNPSRYFIKVLFQFLK